MCYVLSDPRCNTMCLRDTLILPLASSSFSFAQLVSISSRLVCLVGADSGSIGIYCYHLGIHFLLQC
jgi:hypothetical protein